MPLAKEVQTFPSLARASFQGLPGLLADALPDRFGNALINLARRSRMAGYRCSHRCHQISLLLAQYRFSGVVIDKRLPGFLAGFGPLVDRWRHSIARLVLGAAFQYQAMSGLASNERRGIAPGRSIGAIS